MGERLARSAFKTFFVQDRRIYNLPGNPIGQRYGIRASTTAATLTPVARTGLTESAWINPPGPRAKAVRDGRSAPPFAGSASVGGAS